MGAELADAYPSAREVFAEVDDALGENLSQLMRDGPSDALTLTENAQPALMATSLAVIRALESRGVKLTEHAQFVAGHSLGEYSALAAAGALSIADAARLLRTRGRAMQAAVPVGEGAMTAVLGLDLEAAEGLAKEAGQGEVCEVANDNAPGQVVLSGSKAAIERVAGLAKSYGAKRAIPLNVSAPFHCALMQPAADIMAEALAGVPIDRPGVPVVCNVLAAPIEDPAEIRRRLVEQVVARVRWRESVLAMAGSGVDVLFEVGSGKVLSTMARRIVSDLDAHAVSNPQDIADSVTRLGIVAGR